jgi:D-sedoheptulose 7-phosphate isomerase
MSVQMMSQTVARLAVALQDFDAAAPRLQGWGSAAAPVLARGGRLLACGSEAGSREQALHLVAELSASAGNDRLPLAAVPVVPGNGIGADRPSRQPATLAEQVRARGRAGDILVCFSAATPASDVVAAARTAAAMGLTTWALTGRAPNPLVAASDDAVAVTSADASVVEEIHLVAIHIFCAALESCVRDRVGAAGALRIPAGQAA